MADCEHCEAGEHWRCNLSVHCTCDCNPDDPSTYLPDPADNPANNVVDLPTSPPTTCGRCGKPVAIHSVESNGWINILPHDCVVQQKPNDA